jgi:hypothetical protein
MTKIFTEAEKIVCLEKQIQTNKEAIILTKTVISSFNNEVADETTKTLQEINEVLTAIKEDIFFDAAMGDIAEQQNANNL